MNTKRTVLIAIITGGAALLVGGVIGFCIGHQYAAKQAVTSYEECVAAGYPVQESSPEVCRTPDGKNFTNPKVNQPVTMEGQVICLEHKNMDGPHTLECAAGLKTNDGASYALVATEGESTLINEAGSDKRVRVDGTLKKESNDKYKSEGTITVTDFVFLDN